MIEKMNDISVAMEWMMKDMHGHVNFMLTFKRSQHCMVALHIINSNVACMFFYILTV